MNKGFTLIELMITLVIAGILTTIAVPGYKDYLVRGRRSDGQAALLDLASQMERHYSERNTYAGATIGTAGPDDVRSSNQSPEAWYTLSIPVQTASGFTLKATPNGAQATSDTACQSLTLTSLGVKGIAAGSGGAPTGSTTKCW